MKNIIASSVSPYRISKLPKALRKGSKSVLMDLAWDLLREGVGTSRGMSTLAMSQLNVRAALSYSSSHLQV